MGDDTEEGHYELVDSDTHSEEVYAEEVWDVRDVGDGPHILAVGQETGLDESAHSGFGHADQQIAGHEGEEWVAGPLAGVGDTVGPPLCDWEEGLPAAVFVLRGWVLLVAEACIVEGLVVGDPVVTEPPVEEEFVVGPAEGLLAAARSEGHRQAG